MFDQLEQLILRYEEVMTDLNAPGVTSDMDRFRKLTKEQASLEPVVSEYLRYKSAERDEAEAMAMLESEKDEELRALFKEEAAAARTKIAASEEKLKELLVPADPNDEKNIVLEIRSGAGGEEAALFAAEIYRMYYHYAENHGFKTETLEYNESGIGGVSKVTCMIYGRGAYSKFKFESGVHRVQRVPKTESGGRIHTSTITVAVMPEAEDVDVQINMEDCRFDVFRSSGNGGQSVNTTDSAVRLTHYPTGIVISCQDEKSQLKNRDKALKVLRAKLYELEAEKQHAKEASLRKSLVGTGDRSEKIRTYNFPQGRVTDHRINLNLYRIDSILNGDIDEIVDALNTAEQARKMSRNEMDSF